jgi:hypothetical protein
VSEADVVRAKTSVEMTRDLIDEKRRKIAKLEERIHEKVICHRSNLILDTRRLIIHESYSQLSSRK